MTGFADAALKAQPDEPSGHALPGLVATLMEDTHANCPMSVSKKANLIDFTIRRRRRVAKSTFRVELNGFVDGIESLLLL